MRNIITWVINTTPAIFVLHNVTFLFNLYLYITASRIGCQEKAKE